MLDSQDIKLLQNMITTTIAQELDKRFNEQNRKWEQKLDKRFDEQDRKWEQKLDKRFDEQDKKWDLKLEQQFKKRFDEQDKKWDLKLEQQFKKRFDEQDKKWNINLHRILDQRFAESENMILEELDRVEIRLGRRIDNLQKSMDAVNEFYRISLLEKGNLQLLEERVDSLENRLAVVEKTIA